MATQIVMDHSGHSRHHFDAKDMKAPAEAERRFKVLTGRLHGRHTTSKWRRFLVRSFDFKGRRLCFILGWFAVRQPWLNG